MDPNGPLDVHGRVVCDRALAKGTPLGPLGPLVSKGSSPGGLDALAAIAAKAKDNYPDVDKSTTLPLSTCLLSGDHLWLQGVRTARFAEEQNVEVSIIDGQIQFRTIRDIPPGEELRVWFGVEFGQILRLPAFASLVLPDREKKYRCIFCGTNFNYPYPMIGHIMYRCPIRDSNQNTQSKSHEPTPMSSPTPPSPPVLSPPSRMISPGLSGSTPNSPSTTPPSLSPGSSWAPSATVLPIIQATQKTKRFKSFDIATLTDEGDGEEMKKIKSEEEVSTDAVITTLNLGMGLNMGLNMHQPNPGLLNSAQLPGPHHFSSFTPIGALTNSAAISTQLPYHGSNGSLPNTVLFPLTAPTLPQAVSPPSASATTAAAAPSKPRKAAKRAKASPSPPANAPEQAAQAALLSCLPPSLAALSMPSQNWCAKCNTTFRMTSDLVYHMRSHHKREGDPLKRKREEKLRCLICHETFRERHHLTRHMTSHQ
ncbi:PR domain zinc finger protein 8-like [Varroa jacobsoni]|uniref:PR domain zinc finger protein 8 n=1 Tax=Varroa destructor TaxID=109461 RepID=A0A7M7KC84_VARDE|nr:PR domain zinc finger protein 8-like [Varroa destructor]XP_022694497.1 PR domain zinc finger protein 8-like [Varroa jacobsoni]